MNDRETVRRRHPNATANLLRRSYGSASNDALPLHWAIYPGEALGVQVLGTGATEEEAWASAAAGVIASGGMTQ